jgi:hypothetical protein
MTVFRDAIREIVREELDRAIASAFDPPKRGPGRPPKQPQATIDLAQRPARPRPPAEAH